jgi:hypothetical protein
LNQKTKRRLCKRLDQAMKKKGWRFFKIADGQPIKSGAALLALPPVWSDEIGWHLGLTSYSQIAAEMGISEGILSRLAKRLIDEGKLIKKGRD